MIGKLNNLEKADYERIEEVVETLKHENDVNGKPFKIIRVENPYLSLLYKEQLDRIVRLHKRIY
ncbi:hypothetical protein [Bacillus salipaludis]|uniref:hypothetical protein n=1 Tax=Bacillus salipaludis TaxID=2547811 RepID=UPI002E242350|nr:hypothetical protein [Bacillus salipaludis]